MVKHIVMWCLKEEAQGCSKQDNAQKIKNMLENLLDKISNVNALEVGINIQQGDGAYDVVLYSEFDSMEELATYSSHPEHLKVVNFIKQVVSKRRFVDYIL